MDTQFWRAKRVLVTGHTGFKGSWLCCWLTRLGADVTGLAQPPENEPSLFTLGRVAHGMRSIFGDIREPAVVERAFAESRPEIVLHLAAQSLVRRGYREPVETYATNVMGTVHVLEAARRCDATRAAVVVTSDKCYENREWPWAYREHEALGGHDPYSSSKACAELVAAAYRSSFGDDGLYIASARAGNVVGGGDWAEDRLIPDLVRGVSRGETARIRAPHAIRPWQHVLEPLAGYLLLAEGLIKEGPRVAEAWNFGPEERDTRTVGWLVEALAARWGDAFAWSQDEVTGPHEATTLKVDSAKARLRLGWRPRLPLTEALDWLVDWYRNQLAGADAAALTNAQIDAYQRLLTD